MTDLVGFVRSRLKDSPNGPRSAMLARAIEEAVRTGVVGVGDALPAERGLGDALGVSRTTLRRAFEILADAGLLDRRLGAGNFVSRMVTPPVGKLRGFTEDMASRGMTASTKVLKLLRGVVSPDEAFHMGLSPLTPVLRLDRIRYADGEPMSIEYVVVPVQAVPESYDGKTSLYAAMGETGANPVRMLQRMRAELATKAQGVQLGCTAGTALLAIQRLSFAGDGRAVEYTHSLYRGDRYYTVAELSV
jgi:GntR family transcriptional regulator